MQTISTCHGFIENDKKLSLYNHVDRLVLRLADTIIAVSINIKNSLTQCGIKESRISVITNSVRADIEEASSLKYRQQTRHDLGLSEPDFVLGSVGRLSQEKGLAYLIEAALLARNARCPVKLLIIGEGPQKAELGNMVRESGLQSDVIFAGFHPNIDDLLPAMDVFVLPSLTEGTPMALLEAMAHGIPVIASSVGGVPKIMESGKEGILVPPGKPREIATQIQILYNDPLLRASLASAAQRKVRVSHNIKQWTRQIEQEYLKTIRAGR